MSEYLPVAVSHRSEESVREREGSASETGTSGEPQLTLTYYYDLIQRME